MTFGKLPALNFSFPTLESKDNYSKLSRRIAHCTTELTRVQDPIYGLTEKFRS